MRYREGDIKNKYCTPIKRRICGELRVAYLLSTKSGRRPSPLSELRALSLILIDVVGQVVDKHIKESN